MAAGPPAAVASPGDLIRICEYPKGGRPWDLRKAVRVRLDGDRLRHHGLDREGVMRALAETSLIPEPAIENPPPWVVFVHRLRRPDQYEKDIIRMNPEGEIIRLGDVAAVESGW